MGINEVINKKIVLTTVLSHYGITLKSDGDVVIVSNFEGKTVATVESDGRTWMAYINGHSVSDRFDDFIDAIMDGIDCYLENEGSDVSLCESLMDSLNVVDDLI